MTVTQQRYEHAAMKARLYQKLLAGSKAAIQEYMMSLEGDELKLYATVLLEIEKETKR